jgi:predicted O-linked N-acetylglucosamine transferase (SPINDLY family)
MEELIAKSGEEYVRIAVELARDFERLSGIRRGLRERMARSKLCDAKQYTRDLESAYRWMWERHCGLSS